MTRFHTWVLVLLAVALAGYLLPWIVASSGSMTLNAFDVAEWTSLHPVQHASNPPLLAPLFLRLHLLILAVSFALMARESMPPIVTAGAIVLIAVAQLPPLEFVTQLGNENYRQQFALAVFGVVLPLLLWRFLASRFMSRMMITLAAIGITVAFVGQQQAAALFRLSLEDGNPGAGLLVTVVAYAAIIIATAKEANLSFFRYS